MSRHFPLAVFVVGLAAVAWVASGYVGSNPLALSITLLIGLFYLIGAAELRRFRQATHSLDAALLALPEPLPSLGDWLATLHPTLRHPVRLRIEDARGGLPGPAITPFLVGLLVLLGMLGTFLGMVVTLDGAVTALQSSTDLATIRAALAAPIQGLSLAFGTSIAGVAASATLGLMSALCRRERMQVAQRLDARRTTVLREFSRAQQRERAFDRLQQQAQSLPQLLERMQAMMAQMQQQHEDLGERLLAGQDRFHQHAQGAYADLAASVDRSLQHSLSEGALVAGLTLAPVVETTMAGITRGTAAFQQEISNALQQQLDGLASRFDATATSVADGFTQGAAALLASVDDRQAQAQRVWTGSIEATTLQTASVHTQLAESAQRQLDAMAARFDAGTTAVAQAHAALQASLAGGDQQRLVLWQASLERMASSLREDAQRTAAQSLAQQEQICSTLEQTARDVLAQAGAQARSTQDELSRLIDAASHAPRAAAQVVDALREKLSDSLVRDNDMLLERGRIMESVSTLLGAVGQAATEQRGAVDALVASAGTMLERTGAQFGQTIVQASEKLERVSAQAAAGNIEMASMGEAFGVAVQQFGASSEALTEHLQRIEAALDKSSARSDEQLAYYVAQAREIVDLSISSQHRIVEDLQRLGARQVALAGEAAA